ncbi:MAG: CHAD domain-containing protein, partial [Vicinamibacterales bacterium]|nr:CHAD domain-containing protein [Vicinamibacterales bacterium]
MQAAELFASVLDRRVSALRRHLPAALAGDVTGVHQARVASRRLRETLPVLAEADADGIVDRAQRAVRRVTRALGPVRELDVALGLLAAHLEAHPDEVVEGMVVRGWLERLRADQREAMLDGLGERHVDRLWARLKRVQDDTPRLAAAGEAAWRTALGERVLARAEALRGEVTHTGVLYAPEPLHAVRIACKK